MRFVCGIDYSMTSPAIVLRPARGPIYYQNTRLHYLSQKRPISTGNIVGTQLKAWDSQEERYDRISEWALSCLPEPRLLPRLYLEDYSFGSTGKVFNIGENTGLLKHKLYRAGYSFELIPPTVLKKSATGTGSATKERMHQAFQKRTGVDLQRLLQPKAKHVGSPVSDLVDAWFLAAL